MPQDMAVETRAGLEEQIRSPSLPPPPPPMYTVCWGILCFTCQSQNTYTGKTATGYCHTINQARPVCHQGIHILNGWKLQLAMVPVDRTGCSQSSAPPLATQGPHAAYRDMQEESFLTTLQHVGSDTSWHGRLTPKHGHNTKNTPVKMASLLLHRTSAGYSKCLDTCVYSRWWLHWHSLPLSSFKFQTL